MTAVDAAQNAVLLMLAVASLYHSRALNHHSAALLEYDRASRLNSNSIVNLTRAIGLRR